LYNYFIIKIKKENDKILFKEDELINKIVNNYSNKELQIEALIADVKTRKQLIYEKQSSMV
jgi:hypothetical protein